MPTVEQVTAALAGVKDPEINRPITELGMVDTVTVTDGTVFVRVLLTTSGCPLRDEITTRVEDAVGPLEGVTRVEVELGVMDDAQRGELRTKLRGGVPERSVPFAQPGSLTRVICVASGKGGVGKSSVTVNLAAAIAASGRTVGILDADIYGFSVPRMLGSTARPTAVGEGMIMPPQAHGMRVISVEQFRPDDKPVVWRGPMLHRALQQFLTDVWWGDLDVLLIDMPPGTGDVAISVAQLVPGAEILVVTTPQQAAQEVAQRAGSIAAQTHQKVIGVIENMAGLVLPDGSVMDVFGSGGGQAVADGLTTLLGHPVPLLGSVPLEPRLRECADAGTPLVLAEPGSPAAQVLADVASKLVDKPRGLSGLSLGLTPANRF